MSATDLARLRAKVNEEHQFGTDAGLHAAITAERAAADAEIARLRGIESLAHDFVAAFQESMDRDSDDADRDMEEARRLLCEAFIK